MNKLINADNLLEEKQPQSVLIQESDSAELSQHPVPESKDDFLDQLYEAEYNKMLFDLYIQDRIESEIQRMMEF